MTDYQQIANNALHRAKQMEYGSDFRWLPYKNKDGTNMESSIIPGDSFSAYKIRGIVRDVTPTIFAEEMWKFEETDWKQIIAEVYQFKVIESLDWHPRSKICYQINKIPFPLWNRDTVALWTLFNEEDDYWAIATSIDYETIPQYPKKYVRNILYLSSYHFSPSGDGGTEITRLMHINPMGHIPPAIVRLGASRLFTGLANLVQKVGSEGLVGSNKIQSQL